MSWTKRQIIEQAYEELGLGAMFLDLQPDQIESARRKLDTMVAGWSSRNIQIGYPLASEANSSDADQETNVPDYAVQALYLNLAIRLASAHGKVITPETRQHANESYRDVVRGATRNPPSMMYSCFLPSGAGNKNTCNTFIVNQKDNSVLTPEQGAGFFNE